MSIINIGIVGYGNLGHAVEQEVLGNQNLKLVAIFSRRKVLSTFGTPVLAYETYKKFINKIDVMLLCGGSKSDLEIQTPELAKHFNVINTFDTHKKIPQELKKINQIAKENKRVAILSCGWDPGLFSVTRALFGALSKTEPITFWGKGVSMGHSDALRRVVGVEDAVQFTIPNQEAVKHAKLGDLPKDMPRHFRDCYVAADKRGRAIIEKEIKNIPNYFKGQPTKVNFVSGPKVKKLKESMYHKGKIICTFKSASENKNTLELSVDMQSNPHFTASIVCAYINAVINLKSAGATGAFTPLDIPVSYLYLGKEKTNLVKIFC